MLEKLDRLQAELDRLLGGLKAGAPRRCRLARASSAATSARSARGRGAGAPPAPRRTPRPPRRRQRRALRRRGRRAARRAQHGARGLAARGDRAATSPSTTSSPTSTRCSTTSTRAPAGERRAARAGRAARARGDPGRPRPRPRAAVLGPEHDDAAGTARPRAATSPRRSRRSAHERLTDPELGRLLDALEPWAAEQDPDADDVAPDRASCGATSRRPCASRPASPPRSAAPPRSARPPGRRRAPPPTSPASATRSSARSSCATATSPASTGFEHPYDVLLDDFEPGMTTAKLRPLLAELVDGLVPLVAEVAADAPPPEGGPFGGPYAVEDQRRAVMDILEGVGFDPDGWRLDVAPHPFAQRIAPGDVRITTRYDLHDFTGALLRLAARVRPRALRGRDPATGLSAQRRSARPVSLGVHESQSRLWENLVGRGRPFCAWALPRLARAAARRARRHDGRRPLPRRQRRPPQPDPRRGRRDDLQPAHRRCASSSSWR